MSSETLSQSISAWVMVGVLLMMVASIWRIFTKAGEAGWKCLVPIYGGVVFMRILGRPWWWLVLLAIPFVNIVPAIIECFDLARVFGKGVGFGFGLLLLGPIFMLALAFGDARYVGPNRATPAPMKRAA